MSANGLESPALETGHALEGSENRHPFEFTVTAVGYSEEVFRWLMGRISFSAPERRVLDASFRWLCHNGVKSNVVKVLENAHCSLGLSKVLVLQSCWTRVKRGFRYTIEASGVLCSGCLMTAVSTVMPFSFV